MAESSDVSYMEGNQKKPLEDVSKDEVLRIAEKRSRLLQKAKSKIDDLNKKCTLLEEEKNLMVQQEQAMLNDYQEKTEFFKKEKSELLQNLNDSELKHKKIINQLQEEVGILEGEKKNNASKLREKEEQVECLVQQLCSIKESYQCFQTELINLQTTNDNLKRDIKNVSEEKNAAIESLSVQSQDLDSKKNDYQQLCQEATNLKCELKELNEYLNDLTIKNKHLTSDLTYLKNKSKESDNKNSEGKDLDVVFLLNNNEKLQAEIQDLRDEYDHYKKSNSNAQNFENENLRLGLNDTKDQNNDLQKAYDILNKNYQKVSAESEKLKTEIDKLSSENAQERTNLKNEISRLKSLTADIFGFQGAFEVAALQGAFSHQSENTHSLLEENKVFEFDYNQYSKSEGFKSDATVDEGFGNPDLSYLALCGENFNILNSSVEGTLPMEEIHSLPSFETPANASAYKALQAEKNKLLEEITLMKATLNAYVSVVEDRNTENERLQSQLDDLTIDKQVDIMDSSTNTDLYENQYKKVVTRDTAVNTDLKDNQDKKVMMINTGSNTDLETNNDFKQMMTDVSVNTDLDDNQHQIMIAIESKDVLETNISVLSNQLKQLQLEKVELKKKCDASYYEVRANNLELNRKIEDLESKKKEYIDRVNELEIKNNKLIETLQHNLTEVNECHLKLELAIASMKKISNQKDIVSYNFDNSLTTNIECMKTLLEDFIEHYNDALSKKQNMEHELEELLSQKELSDYKLHELKECNQLLEYEVRELRCENEHLKPSAKYTDPICHKTSSELYSIEEIDEKVSQDDSPADNSDSENCTKANEDDLINDDFAVHDVPFISSEDSQHLSDSLCSGNEYKLKIEKLDIEIGHLKSALNDKSALVEKIHCNLDLLLEKNESISIELNDKNKELAYNKGLATEMQHKVLELTSIIKNQKNNFEKSEKMLNFLKTEKDNLQVNVKELHKYSKETMHELIENVNQVFKVFGDSSDEYQTKWLHLENILNCVKLHYNNILNSFELWSLIINQLNANEKNDAQPSFTAIYEANSVLSSPPEPLNELLLVKKCSDKCCKLFDNIESIDSVKKQFFILLHSYLSFKESMISELNEYKLKVVPDLRTTIKDLEYKLLTIKEETETKNNLSLNEIKLEKSNSDLEDNKLKSLLADSETKIAKLKQFAMKLKKELLESKKMCDELTREKNDLSIKLKDASIEQEKLSSEQFQCVQNYQSFQDECDKIQDELDVSKAKSKKLEIELSVTLTELTSYKEKLADTEFQLVKSKKLLDENLLNKQERDKMFSDMECKVIVLESKNQEKVQQINELETVIKEKMDILSSLSEEHMCLKNKLTCSQKEETKKTLLDLEIADYERSIVDLNNKILQKESEINDLKSNLQCEMEKNSGLLLEIKSTETLKETEANRANNLKEILDKTKAELISVKENEAILFGNMSSLQMQLEVLNQQEENYKLQLSETAAEIQNLKDIMKASSLNHQRIVQSYEMKISNQKQEILNANKEIENTKQEFENYKIRVHTVLKQQQKSSTVFKPVEEDVKSKLESVIEKMKLQMQDLSEKLTAVSLEYETLQEEHEVLSQRLHKSMQDKEKEDNEWHTRLEQINVEKNKIRAAQEELSSQHLLQNELLVSTYKKQIKIMSDEHKRTVNELQKQVEAADMEISRLQREQSKVQPNTSNVTESASSFDILSQERQEGEGSENTEERDASNYPLSLQTVPTSGYLSFEKLLQTPLEIKDEKISTPSTEKLIINLNAADKKLEHLNEVLNESESTNLRLSEQVRVLKEEIRRQERNKEREQHAEHLEYLKNVVIKFATLNASNEKAMLVPVLTTMLKLSPSEQQQLKHVAGDADTNDVGGSGWGNYLHRWY